jgi:hypothetical protein
MLSILVSRRLHFAASIPKPMINAVTCMCKFDKVFSELPTSAGISLPLVCKNPLKIIRKLRWFEFAQTTIKINQFYCRWRRVFSEVTPRNVLIFCVIALLCLGSIMVAFVDALC